MFQESREQLRDAEMRGRDMDIKTPKLVGIIRRSLDANRCASILTIAKQFEVAGGSVHRVIHDHAQSLFPGVCVGGSNMIEDRGALMTVLGSLWGELGLLLWSRDQEWESQWKHSFTPRPKKIRLRFNGKLMMIPFFDSNCIIYPHWIPHGQTVKNYCVDFEVL